MKCHLCNLESRQLNGFMSRHWKKHETSTYSRDHYLADLLTANGKPPKQCPICNKQTKYSRENADWDKYCSRECFFESTKGENNPNYKGGLISVSCAECGKQLEKHLSHIPKNGLKFCSTACSTTYYSKPENVSEKRIAGRKSMGEKCKEAWKSEEYRAKMATSMAEAFKDRTSEVERECFNIVKQLYPDARHQEVIGYYAWDIYVPSQNLVIEFDGTYWHGPMCPTYSTNDAVDRRKTTYLLNNQSHLTLVRIKEYCWNLAQDKIAYVTALLEKRKRVILISGPSGSGKSWVCQQLQRVPTVRWDDHKGSSEKFIATIDSTIGSLVVAEIPIHVSTHVKRLVAKGYWVDLVCITESVETVRQRLEMRGGAITDSVIARIKRFNSLANRASFFGTSDQVLAWLHRWNLA